PMGRPEFEAYFSPDWYTSLRTALVDFVQTVFPAMAVPRIMLFDRERREREALQRRIKLYEDQLNGETRIKSLEHIASGSGLVEDHIGSVDMVKSPVMQAAETVVVPRESLDIGQPIGIIQTNEPVSLLKISREDIFLEHNSGISLAKFSVTGDLIASYDDESILKVWSPEPLSAAARLKNELNFTVNAMAWDKKHAHLLYLYDEDGYIHTLNTNTNLMSRQLVFEKKHPWIQAMLASSVSSALLTVNSAKPEGTSDVLLQIWDASSSKTLGTKRLSGGVDSQGISAALNHNGYLAALAYNTGHVRVLDTRSMETVAKLDTKRKDLCAIEFSLNEDSLMAVTEEGRLTQWSLRKNNQMLAESSLGIAAGSEGGAAAAAAADSRLDCDRVVFTPDRENIVVAPREQCLVFNVDSAVLTDATRRHKDLISCIDFAAERSLSASEDGTIRVAQYRKV
ncbi:WD repeat-containing protein 91, partial [Kickxella alabastrina]